MNMHSQFRNSKAARLAVAVIAGVLLATSCSSSSTGDDSDTVGTDDSVVEATATPASRDADTAEPDASDTEASDADAGDTDDADESATDTEPGEDADSAAGFGGRDHQERVAALIDVLPADTRQVFAVDVESLLSGAAANDVALLLAGDGANPTLAAPLAEIGTLAQSIDVPRAMGSAVVAYTSQAGSPALLASLSSTTLEDAVAGSMPTLDRTYGASDQAVYVDAAGNQITLLADGVLVVGSAAAVESIVDISQAASTPAVGDLSPFLAELSPENDVTLAYALPAMFDETLAGGSTLEAARAVVGALDIVDGAVTGTMAFHMANGADFVDSFNALNRASTAGGAEVPLAVASPVVDDLTQVVVTVPPLRLEANAADSAASVAFFKKLFVGMDALEYADGVADRSNLAWLDFVVKSEADPSEPTSPGSVYIRWEFKDEASIAEFEQNELPAGFRLAPTRFIESDDPAGEYFFALNLYNAAGGSIVGGARAEWDVFVHGPDGADPNAGERPRFMVVDVLAEEVSADSASLLTTAEPLTHELIDGVVVSAGARYDADGEPVPVFESSFAVPDPAQADVARFTREMAIGNDYIYWAHGVSDRVFYNATTFNHDAYLVDIDQLSFVDETRWSQYLAPEVKDAVYYVNNLEYVASPMANLDSDYLDITPEWLADLVSFTTNGHQDGLMRSAVEQLFVGAGDPFVGMRLGNEPPATFYHFEVTDPDRLEAALDLPGGRVLAPIALFEGGEAAHYLTLSVSEADGAAEGTRAEWTVYTDDGLGRPPHMVVIETMTEQVDFDPAHVLDLPDGVQHGLDDGTIATTLSSPSISFEASFDTSDVTEQPLSLDWIEAGDRVCSRNGVCDLHYYDAETLDVPVDRAVEVALAEFDTPWTSFVEAAPSVVFYRDNAQEYAVKRWYDLDVAVEPLPFSGLDDPTHSISGTGSLSGRVNDVVDSQYVYSGDAVLDGDQLSFAIVQEIENTLGTANIFTTGSFDLVTGSGTQTVVDCSGDALICSDIENGSTALYVAQNLDAANPDAISWRIDAVVDLGAFGAADSESAFEAERIDG